MIKSIQQKEKRQKFPHYKIVSQESLLSLLSHSLDALSLKYLTPSFNVSSSLENTRSIRLALLFWVSFLSFSVAHLTPSLSVTNCGVTEDFKNWGISPLPRSKRSRETWVPWVASATRNTLCYALWKFYLGWL